MALQLKLNELLSSSRFASNRMVDIEDLTDEELRVIKKYYITLSSLAKKENDIHASHSLDEAELNDKQKKQIKRSHHEGDKRTGSTAGEGPKNRLHKIQRQRSRLKPR